jgi:3-oxoacyl-[acyl-carrier protein] reductase
MIITDKVVAISGAGRGIGRGIAEFLAEKGAKIALLDLDEVAMDETARLVAKAGGEVRSYKCDVADEAMVVSCFNQLVREPLNNR